MKVGRRHWQGTCKASTRQGLDTGEAKTKHDKIRARWVQGKGKARAKLGKVKGNTMESKCNAVEM